MSAGSSSFLRGFYHVSLFQTLNSGCSFLIGLVVARAAGPAAFGNFYFFASTAVIATILFDFGLSRTLVRYTALHRARCEVKEKLGYYSAVLRLKTIAGLAVLGLGVSAALAWGGETRWELALGLMTAFVVSYGNYLANVALTEEDYLSYNLVLSNNTLRFIGVLLLIAAGAVNLNAIYALFLLSPIVLGFIPAVRLGRDLSRQTAPPEPHFYRDLIAFGKWLIILAVLATVQQRLDVFLVRHLTGALQAGYYSGALAFFGIVNLLPGYTSIMIYPRFVIAVGCGDLEQLRRDYRFSQDLISFMAFPMALGLWALAPDLVADLLGPKYTASLPLFAWLTLYTMLLSLHQNSSGLFFAADKPQLAVVVTASALVVNLAAALLLIPNMGITGAAVSICAAAGMSVVLVWALIWRTFRILPNLAHLCGYAATGIIMAICIRSLPSSGWTMLAAKTAAGAVGYLSVLFLLDRYAGKGWIPREVRNSRGDNGPGIEPSELNLDK